MRIAYGVHGYSRGHATRAASILDDLMRRHEVRVFAGGDAYDALSERYEVVEIPTLGFSYRPSGRMSKLETIRMNLPKLWDLFARGPQFARVMRMMKRFSPDVVISDAEAWSHRAALALGIPRIGFDHFGVMVYCRVPLPLADRARSLLDRIAYKALMGDPERVLVSSFYEAPPNGLDVRLVGPLLGDDVASLQPTDEGHLLAYLNRGQTQLTPRLRQAFASCGRRVRAYGPGLTRCEEGDGLQLFEPSRSAFLRDLSTCHAIVSTAGNQLVGEALHLRKPLLVMPEATVEQRLNASAVHRMGIGAVSSFDTVDAETIQRFLAHRAQFAAACARSATNGRQAAIERLEAWITELGNRRARPVLPAVAS